MRNFCILIFIVAMTTPAEKCSWGEARQENYLDPDSKQSREFIVQTNKAQDTSRIIGNEPNILGSKYLPSYKNKIHTSEQLLKEEIYKAFNIHDVSSGPPSPLPLDSHDTADALDDSPAGLTDSQSPFRLSKRTSNNSSGIYPSVMRYYRDKCTIQWRDSRTQLTADTIQWRDSWTQLRDCHGDKVELWAQQISELEAKCDWCQNTFKFDSKGVRGILKHAESLKHKAKHPVKLGL